MKSFLIILAVITCQNQSFASETTVSSAQFAAIEAAFNEHTNTLNTYEGHFTGEPIENIKLVELAFKGFDTAIYTLADTIHATFQDNAMEEELLTNWTAYSSDFHVNLLRTLSMKDLGDHRPLYPELDAFLKELASKYGQAVYALPIVRDVSMLNFAIPVVFAPHALWWQTTGADNKIEYRKHFVPFANLATYYGSLYGCKLILRRQGMKDDNKLCETAAEKIRSVMGRYVAPVVSDWIFNSGKHKVKINYLSLPIQSAKDLQ